MTNRLVKTGRSYGASKHIPKLMLQTVGLYEATRAEIRYVNLNSLGDNPFVATIVYANLNSLGEAIYL